VTVALPGSPVDEVPLSVFDSIVAQLARVGERRVIPLHQGHTAFTASVEPRGWSAGEFDPPPHRDGPPAGAPRLLEAIRAKLEAALGEAVDPARIQVTCGITHALSVTFHALLEPGEEVLVLSPHWLFVCGLVRAAGGVPVEVPVFPMPGDAPLGGLAARIEPHLTARTRAVYFNTPNNPTGVALSRAQLEELVALARERDLWLVSDNAYENYDYSPDGFVDVAALDGGRDRAFAAYSFSKSYGLTGYRIGYLLSPPALADRSRKLALHSVYSVATPSQFAAAAALGCGPGVLAEHRGFVERAIELAHRDLAVPATRADGGFYLFLDLSAWEPGAEDFVSRCIAEGVSLAPGRAFGAGYDGAVRLCHSVVGHDDLVAGIEIVNDVYRRGA
jgi:aspartate aminotransferase/N-succinyldiaminopimelate aminotransferase